MSKEQILRDFYAALNAKDVEKVQDGFAANAVIHVLPNPIIPAKELEGRAAIVAYIKEQLASLDFTQTIDAIAVNGDFATVFVASDSVGPDHATLTVRWADTFRFEGDLIAEQVSLSS